MKTYKWGIIGCGNIAASFAEGLSVIKRAQLFAVASRNIEKATAFGKRHNSTKAYGSYEELIADPDVDVIYIATPHNHHLEWALKCLENKKPILCEKPLAVNLSQVEQIIEAAQRNKTFMMEAMWTRFLPKIDKAMELIAEGAIGEPSYLRADFGFTAPRNPEGRLLNPNLAGGSLLDVGIYTIFYALQFFGYPDKISATAKIGETGVDEHCALTLEYNDGKIAQLFSSIIAETPLTADIAGTKAHITIEKPLFTPSNLHVNSLGGEKVEHQFKHIGNGYNYEAEEVMRCLDEGIIESGKLPWELSRNVLRIMDETRKQIGLKYPFE